jgi:hypothetical protein
MLLLRSVILCFHSQKKYTFFFKHCSVRIKKLHSIKVTKNWKTFGKYSPLFSLLYSKYLHTANPSFNENRFYMEVLLTGKNLFSLQGTLFSLQGWVCSAMYFSVGLGLCFQRKTKVVERLFQVSKGTEGSANQAYTYYFLTQFFLIIRFPILILIWYDRSLYILIVSRLQKSWLIFCCKL